MKAGIRIGLQPGTKAFRLERNVAEHGPCEAWRDLYQSCMKQNGREISSWCIWINPSPDFMHGTYLKLYDNGRVENVTLHPEGHETVFMVKPADGEIL